MTTTTTKAKGADTKNYPIKNDLTGHVTLAKGAVLSTVVHKASTILVYPGKLGIKLDNTAFTKGDYLTESYLTATLQIGGGNQPKRTYTAAQFHLHAPSEHTVITKQNDVSAKNPK